MLPISGVKKAVQNRKSRGINIWPLWFSNSFLDENKTRNIAFVYLPQIWQMNMISSAVLQNLLKVNPTAIYFNDLFWIQYHFRYRRCDAPMVNKLLSKMKGRLLLLLSYTIELSVNQEIDIILFVVSDIIEAIKQSRPGLSNLIL